MASCILLVIKDEHLYLDEFIQYHLNLGINHIFIFEDCTSKTHKNIIDKYNNVTLYNILDLWNTQEEKDEIYSKKIKGNKMQNIYLKKSITYINQKFNYDWCFIIDVDEYITLNDNYNINDLLNEYKDYDAIILQWKNYGANNLIYKPDYLKKGIIETYTKESDFSKYDKQIFYQSLKTVYNMNTFNDDSYLGDHLPNIAKVKWCKSDFSKNLIKHIYNKIYIRHYITKSWEEYVIKLKVRGMFYTNHRNYDDFFEINTDMLNKKEELLKIADDIILNNINKKEGN